MKNGIFTSKVRGFHGPVTANVKIEDGKIKDVELDGLVPYTVGETAAKKMAQKIVSAGTEDVDVITSASYSSDAIKKAVEKAKAVANDEMTVEDAIDLSKDKFRKPIVPKYQVPLNEKFYDDEVKYEANYDLIIAGSGVAGLAAAVIAAQKGLKVMIFDVRWYEQIF